MAMIQADLVKIICEKMGWTLKESTKTVEKVFAILKETLEGGEKIIPGFGNFFVHRIRPRKGRNPQRGDEMVISERRVVTFKPSIVLRRALNNTESSEIESSSE